MTPRKSLCLAEIYAIATTRQVRIFKGPELARFKIKLLIEAQLLTPTQVCLPTLPSTAPATAAETWQVIADLATLRATRGDHEPMPLVAPWLAALSGTDEDIIRSGKRWLEQNGWIVHVGHAPGRFGKRTKLWQIIVEADTE
jgi:hypothetical protein